MNHSSSMPRATARGLCLITLMAAASGAAQAATSFAAVVNGESQIVEVIDPNGPVVRVETAATGSGTPGLLGYFSGDTINLANGQGSGSNRFVTEGGDQLFGSFDVQMVPGADASLFGLIGTMVFTGGTGLYQGASGSGSFLGSGQFVSPSLALTRFEFEGSVSTVPEPASALLLALGLAGCLARVRRQKA